MKAFCTLSFTFILSGQILAEPLGRERQEKPERGPRGGEMLNHMFQRLDADKSGKISKEEFEANPRLERASEEQKKNLFQRLDKNEDGQLERSELRPEKLPIRRDWSAEGPLTFEEFIVQPRVAKLPARAQKELFERMDRNGDGRIDKEDRRFREGGPEGGRQLRERGKERPGRFPFPQMDRDKDGKVTFEEFQQAPFHRDKGEDELEDLFESMDRNGDSVLSPEDHPEKQAPPKRPDSAPPIF